MINETEMSERYEAMVEELAMIVMQSVDSAESHLEMIAALVLILESAVDSFREVSGLTYDEIIYDIQSVIKDFGGKFVVEPIETIQ